MVSIWFFLLAILLTLGFLGVLIYEARTGKRIMKDRRERLDTTVLHAGIVLRSFDMGALTLHSIKSAWRVVLHEITGITLLTVRFLERSLTRLMKRMRQARAEEVLKDDKNTPSSFIEAIKTVKEEAKLESERSSDKG